MQMFDSSSAVVSSAVESSAVVSSAVESSAVVDLLMNFLVLVVVTF